MSFFEQVIFSDIDNLSIDECLTLIQDLENIIRKDEITFHLDNIDINIKYLQLVCKKYLHLRFQSDCIHFNMHLQFPSYIHGPENEILSFKSAPIDLVPYSIFYFLRIADKWSHGAFYRNAGHVKQVKVHSNLPPLAFQEYNPLFPHIENTFGFAGRPGGPGFYISTRNNSVNHGPGSQGSKNGQADSCFAIINDQSLHIIERIKKMEGMEKAGFIFNKDKCVNITRFDIL